MPIFGTLIFVRITVFLTQLKEFTKSFEKIKIIRNPELIGGYGWTDYMSPSFRIESLNRMMFMSSN